MNIGEAREAGDIFIDFGIIFHRARAERIEAIIDAEVAARKRRIMADDIDFIHLGQVRLLLTPKLGRKKLIDARLSGTSESGKE